MAKAFKFRLEALKKYREQRLLLAKKDMALVNARLGDVLEKIEHNIKEESESLADALGAQKSAAVMMLGATLHESARSRRHKLSEEKARIEKELEKHRDWVTHLSRELKAVEKLEEKLRERHEKALQEQEKKKMDSWVAERWSRSPARRNAG